MKRKQLMVSGKLIVDMFRLVNWPDGVEVASDGLPADCRVVGARYEPEHDAVILTLESDEFEPVQDGAIAPFITPLYRRTEAVK